jgi:hypothetical protein
MGESGLKECSAAFRPAQRFLDGNTLMRNRQHT